MASVEKVGSYWFYLWIVTGVELDTSNDSNSTIYLRWQLLMMNIAIAAISSTIPTMTSMIYVVVVGEWVCSS